MNTTRRKYKQDELEHAQKQLDKLKQSGTATSEQIQDAENEVNRQNDIYWCSIGTDY